jgi:hypothetical protein
MYEKNIHFMEHYLVHNTLFFIGLGREEKLSNEDAQKIAEYILETFK